MMQEKTLGIKLHIGVDIFRLPYSIIINWLAVASASVLASILSLLTSVA